VRDAVAVRTRLAIVPQRSNLDRSLRAAENLTFHASYFGMPRAQRERLASDLLSMFGLSERAGDDVMFYSGGMAQRLMIARALMHEPKVLILDEPTVGLDPQSRLFLQDRIAELRSRGITIVLCTHDMAEADKLCDRIAIVDHGRIIALDTPQGLRSLLPGSRGIELTVRSGDGLEARLAGLPGVARVERLEPVARGNGAAFAGGAMAALAGAMPGGAGTAVSAAIAAPPSGDGAWRARIYLDAGTDQTTAAALMNRVLAAATEVGAEIVDLHRVEGSLEDVFIHLTGRELR
jgi:ABC-2 type transport system ATP-binding protein